MTDAPPRIPGAVPGPSFAPSQAGEAARFIAAVQRAAYDRRLTDTARRVHAIVWGWLVPREARRIAIDELAATLEVDGSSVYRALDLLVQAGYLGEGDRVKRERTFRLAPPEPENTVASPTATAVCLNCGTTFSGRDKIVFCSVACGTAFRARPVERPARKTPAPAAASVDDPAVPRLGADGLTCPECGKPRWKNSELCPDCWGETHDGGTRDRSGRIVQARLPRNVWLAANFASTMIRGGKDRSTAIRIASRHWDVPWSDVQAALAQRGGRALKGGR